MGQPSGWDRGQVRLFVRELRKNVGEGWRFLTHELRCALVAQRALQVVIGQHAEEVRVENVEALYRAMLAEAGLTEEA